MRIGIGEGAVPVNLKIEEKKLPIAVQVHDEAVSVSYGTFHSGLVLRWRLCTLRFNHIDCVMLHGKLARSIKHSGWY